MALLPRFIALRHQNSHLQYLPSSKTVRNSSQMVLSEGVFTRFEVVSTSWNNRIHLRSTYNNKFLVRQTVSQPQLVPAADEPEIVTTRDTCTLFRFTFTNNRIQLWMFTPGGESRVGLSNQVLACAPLAPSLISFDVINLSTLVLFPKHVSFKGDNGSYVRTYVSGTRGTRLAYDVDDRKNPSVHFESYALPNGDVRFRSIQANRYWRRMNAEWIMVDSTDTSNNDPATIFRPVRRSLTEKVIGLLNVGNNKYCMRWDRRGQPQLRETMTASATTLEPLTVLTVDEAILDRKISNVVYNMNDIRIYNQTVQRTVPQQVVNNTDSTVEHHLIFRYREIKSERFASSHSWKISYVSQINVTIIPVLLEGQVTLEAHYEGNVSWETEHRVEDEVESGVRVPVPPRTISNVIGLVSRGTIDVPYSYRQEDILLNGQPRITNMTDGLFTGVNTWLFNYEADERPIAAGVMADDENYNVAHEGEEGEREEAEEEDERPIRPSSRL